MSQNSLLCANPTHLMSEVKQCCGELLRGVEADDRGVVFSLYWVMVSNHADVLKQQEGRGLTIEEGRSMAPQTQLQRQNLHPQKRRVE